MNQPNPITLFKRFQETEAQMREALARAALTPDDKKEIEEAIAQIEERMSIIAALLGEEQG